MKEDQTQVWEKIERELDYKIDRMQREDWRYLIEAYHNRQMPLDHIIQTIRTWTPEPQSKSSTSRIKDIPKPAPQRARILAEIVAADANQQPEVTQFREEVLGGTLLKPDEIQQWITQEHDKERGQPAHILEVVLPPKSFHMTFRHLMSRIHCYYALPCAASVPMLCGSI